MPLEGSITRLLTEIKAGDSLAGQQLWERYYRRLVALARNKLREAPRRVADEEDVVLSAFNAFCLGIEADRFPKLDDRDDLWRVLAAITARKAVNLLKYQRRQKRGGGEVRGESVFGGSVLGQESEDIDDVAGTQPTPEYAALVVEECQRLLELLGDDTLRNVAVWKLEGLTNEEIAVRLGCTIRTVERKLRTIRALWAPEN